MARFSVVRLFVSVTLINAGIGLTAVTQTQGKSIIITYGNNNKPENYPDITNMAVLIKTDTQVTMTPTADAHSVTDHTNGSFAVIGNKFLTAVMYLNANPQHRSFSMVTSVEDPDEGSFLTVGQTSKQNMGSTNGSAPLNKNYYYRLQVIKTQKLDLADENGDGFLIAGERMKIDDSINSITYTNESSAVTTFSATTNPTTSSKVFYIPSGKKIKYQKNGDVLELTLVNALLDI